MNDQDRRIAPAATRLLPWITAPGFVLLAPWLGGATPGAEAPQFNRHIRPIKAGLRFDIRAEAVKAEAVVPGEPDQGAVIGRIFDHTRFTGRCQGLHQHLTGVEKTEVVKALLACGRNVPGADIGGLATAFFPAAG
jgi:hypothetical protein